MHSGPIPQVGTSQAASAIRFISPQVELGERNSATGLSLSFPDLIQVSKGLRS